MINMLLLTLATMIWGFGFVGTRWTLIDYLPLWSNSLRFIIAGLLSLPYLLRRGKLNSYKSMIIASILLYSALQLQTAGVKITTLAKSGFLTTFYAIFTPIFSMIFQHQRFRKSYWFLVFTSMLGILFLCELKIDNFNQGDFLILLSAIVFSWHILVVDKIANSENPIAFNFWQCVIIGLIGLPIAFFSEGPVSLQPLLSLDKLFHRSSLDGFLIVAVFSSMLAFTIQVISQKGLKPHVVSLIFLMESVFSAIFGFIFFDEKLSTLGLTGAFIVLASVALTPKFTSYEKKEPPIQGAS